MILALNLTELAGSHMHKERSFIKFATSSI